MNNSTYYTTEAYPSLKEPAPLILVVVGIYLVSFIVGMCGNASTLTLIFGFGVPKQNIAQKLGQTAQERFKVYVACLCFVDSLMLLSLPTTIVDSLIGFWIFGNVACKIHHLCSTVGRLASTLIIASLSIERYLAVISPQKFGTRSNRTTALIMLLLLSLASILLMPLIIFAEAKPTFLFESRRGQHIVHVRIFKCLDSMPNSMLIWFTGSTFFVGYLCPILVIFYFNAKLLFRIRRHQRKISSKSAIPLNRVTAYIVVIVLFYVASWTPYWGGVIYVGYIDIFESQPNKMITNNSDQTMFLLYCAHILPYLNAAVNWLLYGRLARNLTSQQHSSLMIYRNGAVETTSFTKHLIENQSELSWTRKQTIDDNSLYFGSAPTQLLLKSNTINDITVSNGKCRQERDAPGPLAKYEEEIESFETF